MEIDNELSKIKIRWSLENIIKFWAENDIQPLAGVIKESLEQLGDIEKLKELNKYVVLFPDEVFYYNNDGYIQELEPGNLQDIVYYTLKQLLIKLEDAED